MPSEVAPNRYGNYDEAQFLNAALNREGVYRFGEELDLPEDMSDMMRAYIYKDFETMRDRIPFHPLTVASLIGLEEGMEIALNYVENMTRLEHQLTDAKRLVDTNMIRISNHVWYVSTAHEPSALFYHIVDSRIYGNQYRNVVAHYNTSTSILRYTSNAEHRMCAPPFQIRTSDPNGALRKDTMPWLLIRLLRLFEF